MNPDKLCEGCTDFFKEGLDYVVFEFVCLYLRRIKTDVVWKKLLRENTGDPIFKFITPSNIAYILSIMKNGKEMWDQKKRLEGTGGTSLLYQVVNLVLYYVLLGIYIRGKGTPGMFDPVL